tara:strand:- start:1131 stop:3758 length:2628 start_codon:yes stop_codon:yes gene_type:complete
VKEHLLSTYSVIEKDFYSLKWMILFCTGVFLIGPALEYLNLSSDNAALQLIVNYTFLINFLILSLLSISVIQLDPAKSLKHDWLARPLSPACIILAKISLVLVVAVLPTIVSRVLFNLLSGYTFQASVADAKIITDPGMLVFFPAIFIAAFLTENIVKSLAVVLVIVFVVSLPGLGFGPFLESNPLNYIDGLDGVGDFGGMEWLQFITLTLLFVIGTFAVYWSVYRYRNLKLGFLILSVGTLVSMLIYFPPEALLKWDAVFAIQQQATNDAEGEWIEEYVVLDHQYSCFPHSKLEISSSGDYVFSGEVDAGQYWSKGILNTVGEGAIAFSTLTKNRADLYEEVISPTTGRHYRVNWRVIPLKAFATYSAGREAAEKRLRASPSWRANRVNAKSNALGHQWLVSEDEYNRLSALQGVELTIDYSLAVLAPVSHFVPIDDPQQYYPGLGHCTASANSNRSEVVVECIKNGVQPSLISAEIPGISATRVDSNYPSYRPSGLEILSGKKYKVVISNANMIDFSEVLVSAYDQKRFIYKQAGANGVIGHGQEACHSPKGNELVARSEVTWKDDSPHQASMVTVEDQVQLEVLEWEYKGTEEAPRTLILLAGLGATAHVFDDIAPNLAQEFRVLGITRRGFGNSSSPSTGYSIERLSEDILSVINTLHIDNYILVGHSIAGEELNYIASTNPEGLDGLIYLDAAYDRAAIDGREGLSVEHRLALPPPPPPLPGDFSSYQRARHYMERMGLDGKLPEGEIMVSFDVDSGRSRANPLVLGAITQNLMSPNYESIKVPALALFAMPSSADSLLQPWYDSGDPATLAAIQALYEVETKRKQIQIRKFSEGVSNSKSIVLYDAGHSLFLTNKEDVISEITSFLDGL